MEIKKPEKEESMKKLTMTLVVLVAVIATVPAEVFACQGQDCWSWTDGQQWFKQGGWVNDGALAGWQKEKQEISGGAKCGSAEITASQAGLTEFKNEFSLPNLVIKQEGAQFLDVTSSGIVDGSGEFSAANAAKQKTFTGTQVVDGALLTVASDLQKASGSGWASHAGVSTDLNMVQFTEYNAVATRDDWKTEHAGARVQEVKVDASTKKGSFWYEVKQTNTGSTATFVDGNTMVGAMNQSSSTAAAGYKANVTANQTRLDTYNQTLTKPGWTGTQSGGILSKTSVVINK